MSLVAVGVAAVAVSAGAAAYGASEQKAGSKKAAQAQAAAYAQQQQMLNAAKNQGRSDLAPYANSGKSALNELNWQLGLDTSAQPIGMDAVPNTYIPGQTNDPIWEDILKKANASHKAQFGVAMNRPWEADADSQNSYGQLAQEYIARKNEELKNQAPFQGQGQQGGLLKNYTLEDYQNDPGYTPMVNDLESLQATPGYKIQLQQGLDAVNNSAAAKGSLLSSGQLKGVNNYAQQVAATGYQSAWERAQNAYSNAFNRDTSNKSNTFNKLQTVAGMGQAAATNQANISMSAAGAQVEANQTNSTAQQQNFQNQAQANANAANNIAGSITSGLTGYAGYKAGSSGGNQITLNEMSGNIKGALTGNPFNGTGMYKSYGNLKAF